MTTLQRHVNTPRSFELELPGRGTLQSKIYVGFVKVVEDSTFMGRLQVWIPELSGDPTNRSGWFLMNYCTPFAGATNYLENKNSPGYQDSQRSYGMWFVPPDINNEVVCAFINGDPARGIWFGCLYQQFMNHMVPGIAGQDATSTLPVGEYNKNLTQTNFDKPNRPGYSPLADQLAKQGLDADVVRGVTDSSARRATPANSVSGILTPGGSQIVFDDNPSNSFIRLRTQHGAQILLNDTVGCIYLNTNDGKNWVSMDANGRIDIYSAADISIRAQGSLNLRADQDVNIEAGKNINIKARGNVTKGSNQPAPTTLPLPSTTPGPIQIIGDDVAAGIASKISGAASSATPGANSTEIWQAVQADIDLKTTTNIVMALGSNDDVSTPAGIATLTANLTNIKNYITAKKWVWVLPYESVAKGVVSGVAAGGEIIDLSTYPTTDNKNPRSYELLVNDIQQKFVPAETSNASTNSIDAAGSGNNVSTGSNTSVGSGGIVDWPFSPFRLAETGNISSGSSAVGSTPSTEDYRVICANFLKPYEGHAKNGYGSYSDPQNPSNPALVTTGYGHVIRSDEYSKGSIDCGSAGSVPTNQGDFNSRCSMTEAQATGLLVLDVPKYASIVQKLIGQGAWDILGPYQKAALSSVAYNSPTGLKRLVAAGLTTFIANKDIENAAKMLDTRPSASQLPGLIKRKKAEGDLYREKPNLSGGGGPVTVDGQDIPGTGTASDSSVGLVSEDSNITDGFIRIESRNSLHLYSHQHMFLTSTLDSHRYVGKNLYDTAAENVNRLTGGYLNESINGTLGISAGNNIIMISPRVDINGPQPPPAIAAVEAEGPNEYKQSDGILDTIGNLILIQTDTILSHLPFHEPYDSHSGGDVPSIKNVTTLSSTASTTLRDGEVIPNSDKPLDVYGSPLSSMPRAVYTGVNYNIQNQPVYQLAMDLGNVSMATATGSQLSDAGKQFMKSKESGSFVVQTLGNPPKKIIGYGHDLTPDEISSSTISINSTPISIQGVLTQGQITQLFEQDTTTVQTWMIPILGNISVTQTQFDMLCSLAFNIGQTAFTSSPAIAALKNGDYQKIPNNWMKHTVNSKGEVIPDLVIRRRAEATAFITSPATKTIQSRSSNVGIPNNDGTVSVVPSPAR